MPESAPAVPETAADSASDSDRASDLDLGQASGPALDRASDRSAKSAAESPARRLDFQFVNSLKYSPFFRFRLEMFPAGLRAASSKLCRAVRRRAFRQNESRRRIARRAAR